MSQEILRRDTVMSKELPGGPDSRPLAESMGIPPNTGTIRQWLFNPFQFVAGGKALVLGLGVIIVTSLTGSLSNTHFDGVLDTHSGRVAPLWMFLLEGLVDWLSLGVLLLGLGAILSRTRFRVIDLLGTQALARWPFLVVGLAALAPPFQRYAAYLAWKLGGIGTEVAGPASDAAVFSLVTIVGLVMLVWAVVLMYRAFSVSCNMRGTKAIWTFVAGLFLAEAMSKALIVFAFSQIP